VGGSLSAFACSSVGSTRSELIKGVLLQLPHVSTQVCRVPGGRGVREGREGGKWGGGGRGGLLD
jgi:hypothetical protein